MWWNEQDEKSKRLQKVSQLIDNRFGVLGARKIIEAMKCNSTLTAMDLGGDDNRKVMIKKSD